jgi:hypothetical protein
VPNTADRAFVLESLAKILPSEKCSVSARDLFTEALQIIRQIPVLLDRIEHYRRLGEDASSRERDIATSCVKEALKLSVAQNDQESSGARRRLIDLAYRIDPELATSLAAAADDDPARERVRGELRARMSFLSREPERGVPPA